MLTPEFDDETPEPAERAPMNWRAILTVALAVFILALLTLMAVTLGSVYAPLLLLAAIAFAIAPAYLGSRAGRVRTIGETGGFLLGFFLSYLGLYIALSSPRAAPARKCPHCAERIRAEARVCKHCRMSVG